MKKVVFAILALTLSAACASAQITTYRSSSTTVALKATVAEYASITVANPDRQLQYHRPYPDHKW